MLRQARDAIKQVDPTATIVLAGLAPTVETSQRPIWPIGCSCAGCMKRARAIYLTWSPGKPYGFDTPPDDQPHRPQHLEFPAPRLAA